MAVNFKRAIPFPESRVGRRLGFANVEGKFSCYLLCEEDRFSGSKKTNLMLLNLIFEPKKICRVRLLYALTQGPLPIVLHVFRSHRLSSVRKRYVRGHVGMTVSHFSLSLYRDFATFLFFIRAIKKSMPSATLRTFNKRRNSFLWEIMGLGNKLKIAHLFRPSSFFLMLYPSEIFLILSFWWVQKM